MRHHRLFWSVVLAIALLSQQGYCKNRRNKQRETDDLETGNEVNSNFYDEEESEDDVSSDESLMKGRDSGWDPSFLDILSSDYFDESPNPKEPVKKNEGSSLAVLDEQPVLLTDESSMGVPSAPVVEEEEAVTSSAICAGCAMDVDPGDQKISDIASFAFQHHLNSLQDSEPGLHLLEVVKAQTQVVAGQKYMLDIKLGYSNCSKAVLKSKEEICSVNPEKETFVCSFDVLEQKWKNHTELLQVKCDQVEPVNQVEDESELRDPEEAEARIGELDATEETETETPTTTFTTSVVAQDAPPKRRKKRDAVAVKLGGFGGLHDADEDKETLMELARFGVQQLDVIDEDNDARLVIDILGAKKQTISGWLYHLRVRVAQTTCDEDSEVTYEKCKDKIIPPYSICNIKILFQPWQTVQKKVTESQCSQEKTKKGKKLGKQYFRKEGRRSSSSEETAEITGKAILGGFTAVDPDSEDLLKLSEFIESSLDAQSNALHAQRLVRVIEAQRQVVSGVKTKMVIELGYTNCRKSKDLERNQCQIDDSREHNFCSVTVWEQPWVKSKKLTHSKCGRKEELYKSDEDDTRKRRSPPPTFYPGLQTSPSVLVSDPSLNLEEKKFRAFMAQYDKSYETDHEYEHRLGVFQKNLQKIKLLQEYEEGSATYGVTKFADLTEEEFSKHFLGLRPDLKRKHKTPKQAHIPHLPKLPDEFDWRNYNAVTPVKNQGLCGSCWAFSVTGNIEGLYALKHKDLVSFSEQELVDCDTLDDGCNGGLPENAYKILQKIGGLETESEYPYEGRNEKCSFNTTKAEAKVKGYVELPKNETEIAMWLTKNGPISIGINANAMQFYWGGVSKPWKFLCSPKSLDHGVLIVGYGVHAYPRFNRTLPYWSVKNSWGESWGEQGYYRVYRGANTCGVAEMPTSATIF